ncbi:sensor histidine kinase [Streptomyces sp. NPDC012637]|uniref:sensor histidine kinase n=1 Tax=Streptomyces sp. NPDC012637 TaxID=3364842 RepID=UPI0036EA3A7F
MPATMPPSPLGKLPPGGWAALAWAAGLVFTLLLRVRLPGQQSADVPAGVLISRWDGITALTLATLLALGGCALLVKRPLTALGLLLLAATTASFPLGVGEIPLAQFLAVDVALYAVTAARPRPAGTVALLLSLGTLAGYLTTRLAFGWSVGTTAELAVALTAVIAWLLGRSTHQARAHAEQARTRGAEQAVVAERLRIAREMHDMVAHSIGIVALQAGAARRVIDTQPDRARDALAEVEKASRETLAGLRRMLGALRRADSAADGRAAHLPEMPGLADLGRLAGATTAAGVRVDVRTVGEPRPLPPEIELSAFRIVQEAVTNVVRHAEAPSCQVTVFHGAGVLTLTVEDAGRGPRPDRLSPGSSFGLAGMRERVALLHGEFTAGPRPGGGFRVHARLPVPSGANLS